MASSYETKIYPRLMATDEGRNLISRSILMLDSLHVKKYSFNVQDSSYNREYPLAIAAFYFKEAVYNRVTTFSLSSDTTKFETRLDLSDLIKESEFRDLINNHFGKDVPTFNGKKIICHDGRSDRSSKKEVRSLSSWFYFNTRNSELDDVSNIVKQQFADLQYSYKNAIQRLHGQIVDIRNSTEFKNDEREALVQFACSKIKECMMKFSYLGEDALRRGVQTFIIGDIMEL